MIIVKLKGGLGNQMFQAAFGYVMAKKQSQSLYLDTSYFRDKNLQGVTLRDYELDVFDSHFRILSPLKKWVICRTLDFTKTFSKSFSAGILNEQSYNQSAPSENIVTKLDGYWQQAENYSNHKKQLNELFTFKNPINSVNENLIKEMDAVESVSIHIRRGDYVKDTKTNNFHGTPKLDYYQKGLNTILAKKTVTQCYIFTDEPDWVKKHFPALSIPYQIISHNTGKESFEDMRLMSLCKHNIIANSSFSWWGAWLNKSPDKIVVAPKQWYAESSMKKASEIITPDDWLRI